MTTTTRRTRSTGFVAFACRVLCTVAALLPANASTFVLKQLSPVVRDVPIAVDSIARQPIFNRTPPMTTTTTSCHKRPSDTTGRPIRRKSATMRLSSVSGAAPASVGAVPRKRASWSSMSSPRFPTLDDEPGGCDAASKTTSRFSRSANRCRARIPEYRGRNTNGEVVSKNEMTVDVDVAVPADAVPPAKTVSGYASSPPAATIVFTLFVASAALCCWFVSSRWSRRTPKRRRRSLAEYLLF